MLGPDDYLLLGTDLVKDVARLEAAYDDAQGVTAEFNKNVLHVMNRELGADFDVDAFDHVAVFDTEREWIEMRLRSTRAQTVQVRALELEVQFDGGRGDAHRGQRQVHPRTRRARAARGRAWSSSSGGPTPPATSPCSLARRAGLSAGVVGRRGSETIVRSSGTSSTFTTSPVTSTAELTTHDRDALEPQRADPVGHRGREVQLVVADVGLEPQAACAGTATATPRPTPAVSTRWDSSPGS